MVHSRSSLGSPVVQDSGQVGEQLFGRQAGSIILYKVLCSQLIEQREEVLKVGQLSPSPDDCAVVDLSEAFEGLVSLCRAIRPCDAVSA